MIELPDMTFEEAETLWPQTDYAFDATHQDKYPIHGPDAAAFFLEGYLYARKRLHEMQSKGGAMRGMVGTQCGGNSRKAAVKRNLPALIKAKDILTVHDRGISEIGPNVLDVCRIATESPSLLTVGQSRMVWAVWQELAEANKLRGIRTKGQ